MSRAVLVTRVEPGAARTCDRLAALGYHPINAATARIEPLEADLQLTPGEGLALTSPNGARAAARLVADRTCSVFAVGDATAQAAREAGFTRVDSAAGDGAALASLLIAQRPSGVVHVRGHDQAFDLVAALDAADLPARSIIAYAARPVARLPRAALDALEAGAAVLIHSPKGAARLVKILRQTHAESLIHTTGFAVISPAAAQPLVDAGAQRMEIAATPDEPALLEALARLLR